MSDLRVHEYLEHHGILGQKWGKKNGPPYPLKPGDHSASEKKVGWKKSLGGGRNESMYGRNRISKKQGFIGFRDVVEISPQEKLRRLEEEKKKQNYRKIQPESKLSAKELDNLVNDFWRQEFSKNQGSGNVSEDYLKAHQKKPVHEMSDQELKEVLNRLNMEQQKNIGKQGSMPFMFGKNNQEVHQDYAKAHQKKSVKTMSDQELREVLNRLNMEQQYERMNPTLVNNGRKTAAKFLKDSATVIAVVGVGKKAAPYVIKGGKLVVNALKNR